MIEQLKRIEAHQKYFLADGTEVPGVTTVLGVLAKPALVKWANNIGLQGIDIEKYVDKLAQVGTLAHYRIQCSLTFTDPDLTPFSEEEQRLASLAMDKFRDWCHERQPEPIAVEAQLVSERYRFGGTCDLIALVNVTKKRRIEVVDFKTSKAIYPEHTIQLAAYVQLAREHSHRVEGARLVRIGRTDMEGFEERVYRRSELRKHFQIFLYALAIYQLKEEVGR